MRPPYRYRVYGITLASDVRLTLPDAALNSVADVELKVAQPGTFASLRDIPSDPTDWFQHSILQDGKSLSMLGGLD